MNTPSESLRPRPRFGALLISATLYAIAGAGCGMLILFGVMLGLIAAVDKDVDWLSMLWIVLAFILGIKNAKLAWRFAYKPSWLSVGWYFVNACLILATNPLMWSAYRC